MEAQSFVKSLSFFWSRFLKCSQVRGTCSFSPENGWRKECLCQIMVGGQWVFLLQGSCSRWTWIREAVYDVSRIWQPKVIARPVRIGSEARDERQTPATAQNLAWIKEEREHNALPVQFVGGRKPSFFPAFSRARISLQLTLTLRGQEQDGVDLFAVDLSELIPPFPLIPRH